MTETLECETCKNIATVYCRWGLDNYSPVYNKQGTVTSYNFVSMRGEPFNEANLCSECSDILWSQCKIAVNSGIMAWWNEKPKKY